MPPTTLASYAKQANDEELMKMAVRIRDRAIRRAGELLKQIEPAKGGDRKSEEYQRVGGGPLISRREAGEAAGMSDRQVKTAIRVANVPAADFEKQVESANPPTVTKLAEQGKKPAPKPVVDLKGRDPAAFIISENVNRRHLTKSQRAMAVARAYPEPEKGGRGKKNAFATKEFSETALSKARSVNRLASDLVPLVLAGDMTVDDAYKKASLRKSEAERPTYYAGIGLLRIADLAGFVDVFVGKPDVCGGNRFRAKACRI